ncbi:MAG: WYL domain-containing protein [Planctomycetes bacterium]|nr:WYL domain-containing protein [Planctomycetota bacterium]
MKSLQLYRGAEGDYLSRWKRILHIDVQLRTGTRPSAGKLAKQCGVSAKTVYRDIDEMKNELSAPIEYDARRKGFYYSDDGFAIPATALSAADLFALMVAENAVSQYEGTPLADELRGTFRRVLAHLPREVRSQHEATAKAVYFSGLPPTPISTQMWSELTGAIQRREKLDLDYFVPSRNSREMRRVDPYLLVVRDREWFLVGRTQTSKHYALFFLPRIKRVERTGEFFDAAPTFSPERYYEFGFNAMHGDGKPQRVELRFPPEHAHIASERMWSNRQKVAHKRDGSAVVSFESNALFEIERHILKYGGAVEVLKPAVLRDAVHTAATRMAELHQRK